MATKRTSKAKSGKSDKAGKSSDAAEWATKAKPEVKPEIKALQHENKRLRSEIVQYRSGEKIIRSAIEEVLKTPVDVSWPTKPVKDTRKKLNTEIGVLHLSDLHIGKTTSSFGTAIACQRMQELTRSVLHITETRKKVAKLEEIRVYLGGDMVEGDAAIFPKQAHLVDSSVLTQATITAPQMLASCIIALAGVYRKVVVRCVSGNHGRPGSKHSADHPQTCWDRVCYTATKMILLGSDDNPSPLRKSVEFVENLDDFYFVDTLFGKWGNLVVHGHEIRGGFAGYPWYGVGRKALGWQNSIRQQWSYLYLGHFHTLASFTISNIVCYANGALESDNEYALQNFAASGSPVQRLCFYDEKRGVIADYPVYLTERHP